MSKSDGTLSDPCERFFCNVQRDTVTGAKKLIRQMTPIVVGKFLLSSALDGKFLGVLPHLQRAERGHEHMLRAQMNAGVTLSREQHHFVTLSTLPPANHYAPARLRLAQLRTSQENIE
jgi:hypothetical protein